MQQQISLFEESVNTVISDVRTEKQLNNKIAYDTGEVIFGSRKEEALLRKQFEENNSVSNLAELEDCSAVLAAELVTKKQLFKTFSLESEKENGTEPVIARIKQLIIQRIDKGPSNDSPKSREEFLVAAVKLREVLEKIKTEDHFTKFHSELRKKLSYERDSISFISNRIENLKESLESLDKGDSKFTTVQKDIKYYENRLINIKLAKKTPMRCLGDKFVRFFTDSKSANNTWSTVVDKVKSWDDLISSTKEKRKVIKKKPLWERTIPERPDRVGGRQSAVFQPEDLISAFGFRGVQFGNWVKDDKGFEHLLRSSEAFYDLADILGIEDSSISLNSSLAMAYGARGRGSALGHFEPFSVVINLTKEKGCTGVQAHEWFHALDHHLYSHSHSFKNGVNSFMSQQTNVGPDADSLVVIAYDELMDSIINGASIAYFENTNKPSDRWHLHSSFINTYKRYNGDLLEIMRYYQTISNDSLQRQISISGYYAYSKEDLEKMEIKNQRVLMRKAQALAYLHEERTGERVEQIPYPSKNTLFFNESIKLDKGKKGKYWSAPFELVARAFEAHIADILKELGRKNDYLVYATNNSIAFPVGEERQKINRAFDNLFHVIKAANLL